MDDQNLNDLIDKHAAEAANPEVIAAREKEAAEELEQKLEDQKAEAAEVLAKDAERKQKKKAPPVSGRLNLCIDPAIKAKAQKLCKKDNRSLSNYLETLILRDFDRIELEKLMGKK